MTDSPRHVVELPVKVFDHGSTLTGHLRFSTVDVLRAPAFLRAGLLFEIDERLRMALHLPDLPDAVQLVGRVISIHREVDDPSGPGMSIELAWLADDDLSRLQSYLLEQYGHG